MRHKVRDPPLAALYWLLTLISQRRAVLGSDSDNIVQAVTWLPRVWLHVCSLCKPLCWHDRGLMHALSDVPCSVLLRSLVFTRLYLQMCLPLLTLLDSLSSTLYCPTRDV